MNNVYDRLNNLYDKLSYIEKNQLYSSQIGWAYYSNMSLTKVWVFKTFLGPRLIFINKTKDLITIEYLINHNTKYNSKIFKIQANKDSYEIVESLITKKEIDLALYEIEHMCGLN